MNLPDLLTNRIERIVSSSRSWRIFSPKCEKPVLWSNAFQMTSILDFRQVSLLYWKFVASCCCSQGMASVTLLRKARTPYLKSRMIFKQKNWSTLSLSLVVPWEVPQWYFHIRIRDLVPHLKWFKNCFVYFKVWNWAKREPSLCDELWKTSSRS